jgi:hypothetical protein
LLGCKTEYTVTRKVGSPSGRLQAVLYLDMGGGAAGWCYQKVAIVPQTTTFNPARADEKQFVTFSVNCSSRVTLDWMSDTLVTIAYTLGNSTSTYQKRPTSNDGQVRITYVQSY